MVVVGIVAGALLGLLVGRVRTFHLVVQMLVGVVCVGALVGLWYGLDMADPSPYALGLMSFVLAVLGSSVGMSRSQRTPAHR